LLNEYQSGSDIFWWLYNRMRGQIQISRYRSGSDSKAYHNQKDACKNYTEMSDVRKGNYYKNLDLKAEMEDGKLGSQCNNR
jgi:hypothetical protein